MELKYYRSNTKQTAGKKEVTVPMEMKSVPNLKDGRNR
jgi:hypothetical protein